MYNRNCCSSALKNLRQICPQLDFHVSKFYLDTIRRRKIGLEMKLNLNPYEVNPNISLVGDFYQFYCLTRP